MFHNDIRNAFFGSKNQTTFQGLYSNEQFVQWSGLFLNHQVLVKTKARGHHAAVTFTSKRLGQLITQKWLKRDIDLKDSSGNTITPISSNAPLTEDDKDYLKKAGCAEAYEGVRTWSEKLKVCHLQGSQVSILPTTLAEFASGPPSVRDAVSKLQKSHEETFQGLLEGKLGTPETISVGNGTTSHDPRPAPGPDGEAAPSADAVSDLPSFDDEAAMKAAFKIVADCNSFDSRTVKVFMSEHGHVFLLSKDRFGKLKTIFLWVFHNQGQLADPFFPTGKPDPQGRLQTWRCGKWKNDGAS